MVVNYDGKILKLTKSKKVLGIVIDSNLTFKEHIQLKTKSEYAALRDLDSFVLGHRECSQSIYIRLAAFSMSQNKTIQINIYETNMKLGTT